ncbi:hypothetical protein EIN_029750 [Entamoeba invadens IP1]|uniref:RRM domain-containing protein n=1 Tax=Entamoeba invadens IP1 TaxID=370355 RepID=A0A0A1TY44_ENTIV|nr:hypothetical protein EIN_029750 [Entamoeba invadens IP1]ELP86394.1 hypothetical protein EIN_029750 [Entamoeba invadens IP1]|eukprot:XP_004185740.1 hypothetical protein EIN_029750 [Entamoeba invadens IP1]
MASENPLNFFEVKIVGLDHSVTDEAIKAICDEFQPYDYKISRYSNDQKQSNCIIEAPTKEVASEIFKKKNKSEWNGVPVYFKLDKKDKTKKTLRFSFKGITQTQQEIENYFKGFDVKITLPLVKTGELMGNTISVIFKSATNAQDCGAKLKTTEIGGKQVGVVFLNETGEKIKPCFICGSLTHKTLTCPQHKAQKSRVKNQLKKKEKSGSTVRHKQSNQQKKNIVKKPISNGKPFYSKKQETKPKTMVRTQNTDLKKKENSTFDDPLFKSENKGLSFFERLQALEKQ